MPCYPSQSKPSSLYSMLIPVLLCDRNCFVYELTVWTRTTKLIDMMLLFDPNIKPSDHAVRVGRTK